MPNRPTRKPTAALYAALAAGRGVSPRTDLTKTPPPRGGGLAYVGRPHKAPIGELLRNLPWGRG